jgi:hypothetical protein
VSRVPRVGVLLGLTLLGPSCGLATMPRDGRPGLILPRLCPDGGPLKFHQHPSCGKWCGYSCLPDRWQPVTLSKEAR